MKYNSYFKVQGAPHNSCSGVSSFDLQIIFDNEVQNLTEYVLASFMKPRKMVETEIFDNCKWVKLMINNILLLFM